MQQQQTSFPLVQIADGTCNLHPAKVWNLQSAKANEGILQIAGHLQNPGADADLHLQKARLQMCQSVNAERLVLSRPWQFGIDPVVCSK